MNNKKRTRRAFTLVELLVVIAIILILASLGTWGVFAMIGTQQRRNTENAIRIIDKLMHDRWNAVVSDAKKETPSPQVLMLAGGDPARARVIWIKVRLAEAFPTNYNEVLQPLIPPPTTPTIVNACIPPGLRKPHFTKYQSLLAGKAGGSAGESSACLLMALKTLGSDGVSIEDQLKTFVNDKDADGIPELVDAFNGGQPILFLRLPVAISDPQTGAPVNPAAASGGRSAKYADPVDTDGLLLNPAWYNAPPAPPALNGRRMFESLFHSIGPTPVAPSPIPVGAFYSIPVIVSAGRDGKMDVAPDGTWSGAGAKDNICNFVLRGN